MVVKFWCGVQKVKAVGNELLSAKPCSTSCLTGYELFYLLSMVVGSTNMVPLKTPEMLSFLIILTS